MGLCMSCHISPKGNKFELTTREGCNPDINKHLSTYWIFSYQVLMHDYTECISYLVLARQSLLVLFPKFKNLLKSRPLAISRVSFLPEQISESYNLDSVLCIRHKETIPESLWSGGWSWVAKFQGSLERNLVMKFFIE